MRRLALVLLFTLAVPARSAGDGDLSFGGGFYTIKRFLAPSGKTGSVIFDTGFSSDPSGPYDTLLIQGELPDQAIKLEAWQKPRAFFLPYPVFHPEEIKIFPDGRFWARFRFDKAGTQPLKIVLRDEGVKDSGQFAIYSAEALSEEGLAEEPAGSWNWNQPYQQDPTLFISTSIPFPLATRDIWKAQPPKEPYTRHVPGRITLHHTQGRTPANYEEALREVFFIQDFHQNGRKWIDIGYHFLVSPQGHIFEGRPMYAVGAHVRYKNTANIGISLMGNYHPPVSLEPTPEELDSFLQVARYTASNYSVLQSSFYAHRDLQDTDCPGDVLYARMEALREALFKDLPPPSIPPAPAAEPQPGGAQTLPALPDVPGQQPPAEGLTPAQRAALSRISGAFGVLR